MKKNESKLSTGFFLVAAIFLSAAIYATVMQMTGHNTDPNNVNPFSTIVYWIMGFFWLGTGRFLRHGEKEEKLKVTVKKV